MSRGERVLATCTSLVFSSKQYSLCLSFCLSLRVLVSLSFFFLLVHSTLSLFLFLSTSLSIPFTTVHSTISLLLFLSTFLCIPLTTFRAPKGGQFTSPFNRRLSFQILSCSIFKFFIAHEFVVCRDCKSVGVG